MAHELESTTWRVRPSNQELKNDCGWMKRVRQTAEPAKIIVTEFMDEWFFVARASNSTFRLISRISNLIRPKECAYQESIFLVGNSEVLQLIKRHVKWHYWERMIEMKNSPVPNGIRTHDFLITWHALNRCATTTVRIPTSAIFQS